MKIKFIKDHPAGIKEGLVTTNNPTWCNKMISEGYAEEIKEVNRQADVIIKLLKSRKVTATMMAIDGVPGSGKSTLARALAKKMDFKWKALDYIDMDRPLKFKHVNTIYEHHRLFRTQDIDFFDVLIYIDEPIERSKKGAFTESGALLTSIFSIIRN